MYPLGSGFAVLAAAKGNVLIPALEGKASASADETCLETFRDNSLAAPRSGMFVSRMGLRLEPPCRPV
jgi:hypothetical protein